MNLHVVVAEKSFEAEKEAVTLYKELLRLGMMVRLVEETPDKLSRIEEVK